MHKTILLLFALLLWLPVAQAQENGGDSAVLNAIKGYDLLTSAQKDNAREVLEKTNCYFECSDTIMKCLKSEKNRAAKRLAAFVVRRALMGLGAKDIMEDVQRRALSAFPPVEHKSKLDGLIPYGDPGAPVKAVIYADFECPYCGVASPSLKKLVDQLKGRLVIDRKSVV